MFFAGGPKKETPTRGVKPSLLPSPRPLVVFAVGRGAGLPEKDATIERCNNTLKHAT